MDAIRLWIYSRASFMDAVFRLFFPVFHGVFAAFSPFLALCPE